MMDAKKDEGPVHEKQNYESHAKLSDAHVKRVNQMVNEYKIEISNHLNQEQDKKTNWPGRLADKIASFGGSWPFIIIFLVFLFSWMIWNTVQFTFHFDESPFILLNLILSCLAAFQAPVILMSQNRQAARDKQESIMDFAINSKAEEENLEIQIYLKRMDERLERMERRLNEQSTNQQQINDK
jgi:uncharacterized membrane protein